MRSYLHFQEKILICYRFEVKFGLYDRTEIQPYRMTHPIIRIYYILVHGSFSDCIIKVTVPQQTSAEKV